MSAAGSPTANVTSVIAGLPGRCASRTVASTATLAAISAAHWRIVNPTSFGGSSSERKVRWITAGPVAVACV